MARLNLDFYTGDDQYSDGNIENEMLKYVQGDKTSIYEENQYSFLYHFSPRRENVLSWYPFEKNCKILEVGAGCGAITGMLCSKAREVVSIDLSKRRSIINLERHNNCDNLSIYVGNLYDIDIEQKFDYVIVNGVMEYAISFTDGETPYETFLDKVSSFLNDTGKLIIAIENRLGLKYFAGAPEDHTNNYFLGINKYEGNNSVRTFSKKELINLLSSRGYRYNKFYYPYPDYKFPNEIFSDDSIYSQKYGRPYYNLNGHRFELFNESKVAETLINEECIESFANSFVVIASRVELNDKQVVEYVKFSDDRNEEYRICTKIISEKGQKKVCKQALSEQAHKHIDNIYNNSQLEFSPQLSCLKAKDKQEEEITYDFITTPNLMSAIVKYCQERDGEKIWNEVTAFFDVLNSYSIVSEYGGEEFENIFGYGGHEESLCMNPANIDMILDNIYEEDKDRYLVIDGEWIYHFPIPTKFIIWRAINELYNNQSELDVLLPQSKMFDRYQISESDVEKFLEWNLFFTEKYIGCNTISQYAIEKDWLSLDELRNEAKYMEKCVSSLYLDFGEGYSEEKKIWCEAYKTKNVFVAEFTLSNVDKIKIKQFRFDPIEEHSCKCKIIKIYGGISLQPLNASSNQDGYDVFFNMDPIYEAKIAGDIADDIKIIFDIQAPQSEENILKELLNNKEKSRIKIDGLQQEKDNLKQEKDKLQKEKDELRQEKNRVEQKYSNELNAANATINDILTSRSWKFIVKLRKIKKFFVWWR